MRLLQIQDSGKFSLVERVGNDIPPYAILSHTWGPSKDEVTYHDLLNGTGRNKMGYCKLEFCRKQAEQDRLQYFWVDTCCIDKTSSAELSEAINSMYSWYQAAEVCYAYLADVPSNNTFSCMFFGEAWEVLGTRVSLQQELSECTKIPASMLAGVKDLEDFSIAQRMSWAASRTTTRIEDRAYCLLGMFDVNMPLIYGEGENAFIRLQEEIIRISDDQSLFAWRSTDDRGGCLATSPSSFSSSGNIVQGNSPDAFYDPTTISSSGIHLNLHFIGVAHGRLGFAILNCCEGGNKSNLIAISVKDLSLTMQRFKRIQSEESTHIDIQMLSSPRCTARRICIQKQRITRTRRAKIDAEYDAIHAPEINHGVLLKNVVEIGNFEALLEAVKMGVEDDVWLVLTTRDIKLNGKDGQGQSIWTHAAKSGNERIMSMLLDRSNDQIDQKDVNHRTPLSWAAEKGHEAVVKMLLITGKVDVNSKDNNQQTPLLWAAEKGHEAVVKLLLDAGVDVDLRNYSGYSPLFWAAQHGPEAVVKLLLNSGADVDSRDYYQRTPLSWAAERGHEAVVKLLLNFGAEVNSEDKSGQTPLSCAAEMGHEAVVRLLLDIGVDIDSKNYFRQTPLFLAALSGHEVVVKLLLNSGVDVDPRDCYQRTPLSWVAENGHEAVVKLLLDTGKVDVNSKENNGQTPLLWAAEKGHEAVVKLLLDTGVDVNLQNNSGHTPLFWAVRHRQEAVFKLLLDTGVGVDSKNNSGRTPLSWAAENGNEAVVKLLLDTGKVDTNSNYVNGQTPLYWAAQNGHEAVVKLLLSSGVEVDFRDSDKRTPRSLAAQRGHEAVVKLLQNYSNPF